MTTRRRRTSIAITADIRECAAIWRARAHKLSGNLSAADDFAHALKCADRFEAQLVIESRKATA
jgi:hypothetical protein